MWNSAAIRLRAVRGCSQCAGISVDRFSFRKAASKHSRPFSSFLADAFPDTIRDHIADQTVERIIHGKSSKRTEGRNSSFSLIDSPTADSDEFIYDIDLQRRPTGALEATLGGNYPDPLVLVADELRALVDGCMALLGTDHPVLAPAVRHFFEVDKGKKIRPAMVLLMSRACNSHNLSLGGSLPSEFALTCQRRLAEITEMIHTASLFHDDVIDKADTRRGSPSANSIYGNKVAILAGDFLLARSCMCTARLRSLETVEILSTVIEHLVKGEVLQTRPLSGGNCPRAFEHYVRKTYYKTGSLMANSCRAAAVLGGHGVGVRKAAHEYGKRIGLAFQLVDDVLDFEGSAATLGKPVLSDLREGVATAPVLLAAQEHPALVPLIGRKFCEAGDVEAAHSYVQRSAGLKRTKELATVQAEMAMESAMQLSQSTERDALIALAAKVVFRNR